MKPTKNISMIIALFSLLLYGMSNSATAADVDARLSTREAWVGIPVVLQLSINNAADYEQPTMPEIDGCDIRSAGAPSQSTQTMIVNGRRSDTRSVVMQYLITPRREGTYEIPPIAMKVDGRSVTTQKLRFVATKSQTGNLLFVQIDGGKGKVFVGQPLELKLKIWIKPFQDPERKLTLSEENMWQMISEQTSWGSFLDRMKELAANNQRPGGKEVLRDDGQGNERSYYLYEISATVYPKRPGKIDADDLQIVVDYPTELGKARDPFGDFFGGSPFGGRSPLSQMMDDDVFSSPFSNRLTVSASRPIVAEAKVDATEVLPVPAEGRPADYRGAVGSYDIVTQATPTAVKAGDPITLNIGIAGTGPMELVQAPPLFELPSFTEEFKVADQSLAGFVQENTKLFSTTIRPRREGTTQIPAIPFSFFNPDTGKYETVMSEPIAITVDKSESLSLDAIVGKQRHDDEHSAESSLVGKKMEPDFTNDNSASVLLSQSPPAANRWWWFVIVPPVVWMITVIVRHQAGITRLLPSFRSAKTRCFRAIHSAERSSEIVAALTRYIASRTKVACSSSVVAVGALRTAGIAQVANDVEAYFLRRDESEFSGSSLQSLSESREEASALLTRIENALNSLSKSQVRRSGRAAKNLASRTRAIDSVTQRASMFIIALVVSSASAVTAAETSAAQSETATAANATKQAPEIITFSPIQQETLLKEAGDLYSRATDVAKTDSAEANDLFTSSAAKYQLLVDSGVHNARLYGNLGNACLQSNQLGRAIVNYERARRLDPGDRQLAVNLEFANSLVKGPESKSNSSTLATSGDAMSPESILQRLHTMNALLIDVTGMSVMIWTLVISSLMFWSLLTARAIGYRFPLWRFLIVPLLLLATSLTSAVLASTQLRDRENAVVVASNITLHAGDGESFESVLSLDAAQGHRVRILTTRGDWTQVKTRHGQTGWMPSRDLETISI